MKDIAKGMKSESRLADMLDGIRLSPSQMTSAKARMDQAETIANAIAAVGKAVGAVVAGVLHGSHFLARRVRAAFMKPAHH